MLLNSLRAASKGLTPLGTLQVLFEACFCFVKDAFCLYVIHIVEVKHKHLPLYPALERLLSTSVIQLKSNSQVASLGTGSHVFFLVKSRTVSPPAVSLTACWCLDIESWHPDPAFNPSKGSWSLQYIVVSVFVTSLIPCSVSQSSFTPWSEWCLCIPSAVLFCPARGFHSSRILSLIKIAR